MSTYSIPLMVAVEKSGVVNSRFFPRLCSLSLIVFAIIMVFEDYLFAKRQWAGEERGQAIIKGEVQRVAIIGSLSLLYLLIYKPLGHIVCSILFIGCFFYLLGTRRLVVLVPLSLLVPLLIYIVFRVFLNVPLPEGIFSF